jgi:hypothetical protein
VNSALRAAAQVARFENAAGRSISAAPRLLKLAAPLRRNLINGILNRAQKSWFEV